MSASSESPYASYIEGWARRHAERAGRLRRRAEEARAAAERCARMLAAKHAARRVWLYGSTLTPERFHEHSDIDLAVEGLKDWLGAAIDCEPLAPGFDVSILPIEDAVETLRRRILEEGVLLHEPPA